MFVKRLLLLPVLFILSCTPQGVVKREEINKRCLTEQYFKNLSERVKRENPKDKGLDWYLNAGSVLRYAYDIRGSFKVWDKADSYINLYEAQGQGGRALASLFVNDLIERYNPPFYERIFLNILQSSNALVLKDRNLANVEINRALERIKEAEYRFRNELKKEEEKVKKTEEEKGFRIPKRAYLKIEKAYSVLDQYKPYRGFANPLAYYLKGILYYEMGDYNSAADMFKVAYALVRNREEAAPIVAKDWEIAFKGEKKENRLWVVFLNGLSFEKVEKRFDIPLFLISGDIFYVGIALPWLKERKEKAPYLVVYSNGKAVKSKRLVNVNNLIAWEFKRRLPAIFAKEVARAAVKALIQYEVNKHFGALAGLAVAIYQFATTQADTRQWNWLPAEVQIAEITYKPGKPVYIKIPGHKPKRFVFNGGDAIIFVRALKPCDEVFYYAAQFE